MSKGIDIDRALRCARRELEFRHTTYPRRVDAGAMASETSAAEIAAQTDIVRLLEWVAANRGLFKAAAALSADARRAAVDAALADPATMAVLAAFPGAAVMVGPQS